MTTRLTTVGNGRKAFGVNIAGYIQGELGLGQAVRGVIQACEAVEIPYSLYNFRLGIRSRQRDFSYGNFSGTYPYPINLVNINPDRFKLFSIMSRKFLQAKYTIGLWAWELPDFPKPNLPSSLIQEVWVATDFEFDAVKQAEAALGYRTVKIPFAVTVPRHAIKPFHREKWGISHNDFLFLFVFDFRSFPERKNPLAVVKAFLNAFKDKNSVKLILKSINGRISRGPFANYLRDSIKQYRNIIWIDQYFDRGETLGLLSACDAYVSLHRAEGFGLTIAEAMLLGKPTIVTGWSGNMDFTSSDCSYLVDYRLVPVGRRLGPYSEDSLWAEPNVEHAAYLMRELYKNSDEAHRKGMIGAQRVGSLYSPQTVGKQILARLAEIIQPM
ncbi:probable glycosyl transferase [Sulfobacillus acidophilus TPY]|uniref:Glycosyl transferase group 1 n=1 Tax=Sulfobacillus acidophilus (strain ATCC 700253 / DSM 10332 / NAL) TaxID=679936 RepID=G8TU39_SULAD|nr:probable glycosyl transferase [Sulfobacillus acidophilus TPY]AEW05711.1 glycosyl transferase group 1 [Sulfobacillus acidophilus DSM 10332]